ncbi:hypothetical protein AN639_09505 [Candidatus Epulonipiscium fishelsonii]|nr:hypothetical protein AN639_09505 [Epulopiscium sp. SCG-B05WGA-EpuloA1]
MKLRNKLILGVLVLYSININNIENVILGRTIEVEKSENENGEKIKDGKRWFYKDGNPLTGLQTYEGKTAYYLEGGGVAKGWKEIDGKQYYFFVNGSAVKGIQIIGNTLYGFNNDGTLAISEAKSQYVTDEKGVVQLGWQMAEGNDYYFFEDGTRAIGIQEIDGITYAFNKDSMLERSKVTPEYVTDENGIVQRGWQMAEGNDYYFFEDGTRAIGMQEIDGHRFGFNDDGTLARNQSIGGYQLDENGIVKVGWQTVDGKKYYFTENGIISDGIHTIDGKKYGFKDGALVINGQVDGLQTDENGILRLGWQVINGKKHYFTENGIISDGIHTLDGIKYGFKDGALVINGQVDIYKTNSEGHITTKAPANRENFQAHIIDKLNTFGWNEQGVNKAVKYKYKYKVMSSRGDTIEDAIYLINNGKAACYGYASLAYHMWLEMEYEARYIIGIGRLGSEHAWVAVKKPEGWRYYDSMYQSASYTEAQLVNMGYRWDRIILT